VWSFPFGSSSALLSLLKGDVTFDVLLELLLSREAFCVGPLVVQGGAKSVRRARDFCVAPPTRNKITKQSVRAKLLRIPFQLQKLSCIPKYQPRRAFCYIAKKFVKSADFWLFLQLFLLLLHFDNTWQQVDYWLHCCSKSVTHISIDKLSKLIN
jgi:hypothetical protein